MPITPMVPYLIDHPVRPNRELVAFPLMVSNPGPLETEWEQTKVIARGEPNGDGTVLVESTSKYAQSLPVGTLAHIEGHWTETFQASDWREHFEDSAMYRQTDTAFFFIKLIGSLNSVPGSVEVMHSYYYGETKTFHAAPTDFILSMTPTSN